VRLERPVPAEDYDAQDRSRVRDRAPVRDGAALGIEPRFGIGPRSDWARALWGWWYERERDVESMVIGVGCWSLAVVDTEILR
jgi:hypothetical protein